jgi:hypothetical protein
MANLVSIYESQGRWEAAEQLNEQVVRRRRSTLGDQHPHTRASMEDLLRIYQVNIADGVA